ncbi:MAG: hypothetical protein LBK99_04590 [Opitutaceae bacterium]|jgi:hypothetical protein|nr:hypothetical protein [Opitutaceae bacterium]
MKNAILASLLFPFCAIAAPAGTEPDSPIRWTQPADFDPAKPNLGLPVLRGAKHSLFYTPEPSRADPADGGGGAYESLLHGTYNHHQQFLLNGDKLVVYWTNHVGDENGPGQRILAKTAAITSDGSLASGRDETLCELASPVMPAKRRRADNAGDTLDGAATVGTFLLSPDGRMFLRGQIFACDGWTDDMRFHNSHLSAPVPPEHYRSGLDKKSGFRWDIYWALGRFVREFAFVDGKLAPVSPVFILGNPLPRTLEVTPGLVKKLAPLNPPWRDAQPLAGAPQTFRDDFAAAATRERESGQAGPPPYAKGVFKLAANGKNGLAHYTEFCRPDGKWVVVRDNLLDPTNYYAAVREPSGTYPPGIRTNLFGTAMPVAGNLPDGSAWIIGSNMNRTDIFITTSRDGITFDRTWSLIHRRERVLEGVSKPLFGGPQYFKTITVGRSIWLVYSIGKESLGLTEIPFAALQTR